MEQLTSIFTSDFGNMLLRFLLCIVVNWVIIDRLYFRKVHRRDFYFTFMLISVAIFFLVYFMMGMDRGKATMGVGLGLFGIFSIMRYRTDTMPVREMTYLFVIICLSVVNALAVSMSYAELLITNVVVILAVWLAERHLKIESTKLIQYDRMELIVPERREELLADLEKRTGLKITKIELGAIDMIKDMAIVRITYESDDKGQKDIDHMPRIKRSDYNNV